MMRIWMRALAAYRVPLIPADQLALVARRAFMRERRSHESPPYTRQMSASDKGQMRMGKPGMTWMQAFATSAAISSQLNFFRLAVADPLGYITRVKYIRECHVADLGCLMLTLEEIDGLSQPLLKNPAHSATQAGDRQNHIVESCLYIIREVLSCMRHSSPSTS
jgi:hypothetical protein